MSGNSTSRITIDPAVCNGKPTIRGLRITVQTVLEYLSVGETHEEILRQFPFLEAEDISACLALAERERPDLQRETTHFISA
jgi:uncharacterized protein (DUF433 family)